MALVLGQSLTRAVGLLAQVERGTGEPTLLFQACEALQEAIGGTRSVDPSYTGVAAALKAAAQALQVLSSVVQQYDLVDPSIRGTAVPPEPLPQAPPPPSSQAVPPPSAGAWRAAQAPATTSSRAPARPRVSPTRCATDTS